MKRLFAVLAALVLLFGVSAVHAEAAPAETGWTRATERSAIPKSWKASLIT